MPGRIEVLGKHTDYAGGATLTCAVERGVCAVYSPAARRASCVCSTPPAIAASSFRSTRDLADQGGRLVELPDDGRPPHRAQLRSAAGRASTSRSATRCRCRPGMSSSSALMTAMFLALADVNRLQDRPAYRSHVHGADRPRRCTSAASRTGSAFGALAGDRGVGTFGRQRGSHGHPAARSRAASATSSSVRAAGSTACPSRPATSSPSPRAASSPRRQGTPATGTTARRCSSPRSCGSGARGRALPTRRCARPCTRTRRRAGASRPSSARAARKRSRRRTWRDGSQHFLLENETLVPAASRALAAGDVESFGRIADASQRGAEDLLQNQVSETVSLARMARELGAAAASAFGAGFGGSVWALVKQSDAPSFSERWQAQYRTVASRSVVARASFFVTAAGPPATAF